MDVCRFFVGLQPHDLPDGEGWALERVQLTTHNGTHLDAPHFPDGYVVRPQDTDDELARVGHRLQPLDIVVVNTRAGFDF